MNHNDPQDEAGIRQAVQRLNAQIEQENGRGIPTHRIVLAGFSQGGALALCAGLRYPEPLAGLLGLSTFLPLAAELTTEANTANQKTPIMMAHGIKDPVLARSLAKCSYQHLKQLHYPIKWHTYPMEHQLCGEEIQDIATWLGNVLK